MDLFISCQNIILNGFRIDLKTSSYYCSRFLFVMHVGLISTLGGGVGRVTNHLIQGLSNETNIKIDLFQVDNRLEFNIDDSQLNKKSASHTKK